MKIVTSLLILFLTAGAMGQANTWSVLPEYDGNKLQRRAAGLVYLPDSNRFLISMGALYQMGGTPPNPPYSEQVFSLADSIWKNHFPAGKLGVWGDTTGPSSAPGFNTAYFAMRDNEGNTRPNLRHWNNGNAYFQYAYNTDDNKVYCHIYGYMLSYDPNSRVWEILTTPPEIGSLSWGSLCYDPHNQEIVLFGGTCSAAGYGSPGTWIYKTSTDTWTRLSLATAPPARCGSPLVYDAKNRKIILFSGDRRDYLHADTWVYDVLTKTWSKKTPALCPRPRSGHNMIYLPKSQKVVMMGGFTIFDTYQTNEPEYTPLDTFEIWTYDAAAGAEGTWSLIKHFNGPDPGCMQGALPFCFAAAADTGDRIIAVGAGPNSYYEFNALTYYLECDPTQIDAAGTAAYQWKTDSVLARTRRSDPDWFRQDDASIDTAANENLLANLPENVWTQVTPPKYPYQGRDYGTAVFSPDHDAIIRWGGGHATLCFNGVPQYFPSSNRWTIGYRPESSLEAYRNSGGPSPTFGGRPTLPSHPYDNYDYCPILKKVVLWQRGSTRFYDPAVMDWDTLRVPVLSSMGGSLDYHRALNATPHGMVAWAPPAGNEWGAGRLWIMDTLTLNWQPLTINGTDPLPAVSDYSGLVYDGNRDRLIFASKDSAGQLWEYRFADSVMALLNPGNRGIVTAWGQPRECVYLPFEDEVVFLVGVTVDGKPGHLVYDCAVNTWHNAPVTGASGFQWQTGGTGWALRYDNKRKLMLLTTDNNQVYFLNLHDTAASTAASLAPRTAQGFSWQASPNPFTGDLLFRVRGIEGERPDLRIYDVRGRLVADLSPAFKARRVREIHWRAGNRPSGIYVAKLTAGERVYKKRLVLAK